MPFLFWRVTGAVLQINKLHYFSGQVMFKAEGLEWQQLSPFPGPVAYREHLYARSHIRKANTVTLKANAGAETVLLHSSTQFAEQKGGGYGAASLIQAAVRPTQRWWM